MSSLLLHPATRRTAERYLEHPSHALVVAGPRGIGKESLAVYMAAGIVSVDSAAFASYPYKTIMRSIDDTAISIDQVRELQQFLALKIPGDKPIARVVMIVDAHLLSVEAQNALLKLLEEPPLDTVFILTVAHMEMLLPTIRSRVSVLQVSPPPLDELQEWYKARGYAAKAIERGLMITGGLPGLTTALLAEDTKHPLYEATETARAILQRKGYERLLLVDSLSKQKQQTKDVLFVLAQMARMALLRDKGTGQDNERWTRILKTCFTATEQMQRNVQPKLVLTHLMLEL